MTAFLTLLVREWREWRSVMMILGLLYLLALAGTVYGMHKGANFIESSDAAPELAKDFSYDDDDFDWFSGADFMDYISPELILFGFTHSLRGTATMINLVLVLFAIFYFADAVYRERADGSTYFYRALPVQDHVLLGSKMLTGTVGILGISYLLGAFSVAIARLTVPSIFVAGLEEVGLSLSQIAYADFLWDWLMYHLMLLLWFSPYAAYMLFVSAGTKGRPLMVGIGLPILLSILTSYFLDTDILSNLFTSNLVRIGEVLAWEWQGQFTMFPEPDEQLELFRSFGGYIASGRSLISLAVAGSFFGGAWFVYRKNIATS